MGKRMMSLAINLRHAAYTSEKFGRVKSKEDSWEWKAADLIEKLQQRVGELETELLADEFKKLVDWEGEIKHLHERCERLNKVANEHKQENQALAAHVERIDNLLDIARVSEDYSDLDVEDLLERVCDAAGESPQTSLAEVRAKQAEESFKRGAEWQVEKGMPDGYFEEEKQITERVEASEHHAEEERQLWITRRNSRCG